MKALMFFSDFIIPGVFLLIILSGLKNRVDIYKSFTEGAVDGFRTVVGIMPTLIGLMVAVGFLRASGALNMLSRALAPATGLIGFPPEAVPLALMRLVSSSASAGLLLDLYKTHGPDSFLGRFVSVMMSSTETVFYTMSVYFMSVKVTKTRYTLASALIANLAGIIGALFITKAAFGY